MLSKHIPCCLNTLGPHVITYFSITFAQAIIQYINTFTYYAKKLRASMFLSNDCESLACSTLGASNASRSSSSTGSTLAISISLIPFMSSFFTVGFLLYSKLFPLISQPTNEKYLLNSLSTPRDMLRLNLPRPVVDPIHEKQTSRHRDVGLTFSVTISLATVLVELILCEISNTLHPEARALALKFILPSLLFSLVFLIPFLELKTIISAAGWNFKNAESGKISRITCLLQICGFSLWLMCFWWSGKSTHTFTIAPRTHRGLTAACLDRVGIIGIALMALLSGFASVSAIWHTFGARLRTVNETDVSSKQAGLNATNELLADKQSRLRALQRKVKETPNEDFMTKVIGNIRGNSDAQEIAYLETEISGLMHMTSNLSSSVNLLQNRLALSRRASSRLGRFILVPISHGFSVYCIYRIMSTILSNARRLTYSSPTPTIYSPPSTDPINRILSLVAKHVDPGLNQLAWSRQISFLLSGVILLASFNSVLTTFQMLTKLTPSLLRQIQANLALLIAQISATYVISSALLLRSNLPNEMKSIVNVALGSPLEPIFVERWFDIWFLLATLATAIGIWISRKLNGKEVIGTWDDMQFAGDIELDQKRL
ncbi:Golgi pH regulator [Golovinomyces cichoracearum]|uniref:Golgi pH regulator n=1 Tax=Golovinomyces cichoracearum TaxID=62708 RepID=A0A420HRE3_9PEZI|nr:Golgi pH regulator [Golovinomyces cichoracearum]